MPSEVFPAHHCCKIGYCTSQVKSIQVAGINSVWLTNIFNFLELKLLTCNGTPCTTKHLCNPPRNFPSEKCHSPCPAWTTSCQLPSSTNRRQCRSTCPNCSACSPLRHRPPGCGCTWRTQRFPPNRSLKRPARTFASRSTRWAWADRARILSSNRQTHYRTASNRDRSPASLVVLLVAVHFEGLAKSGLGLNLADPGRECLQLGVSAGLGQEEVGAFLQL